VDLCLLRVQLIYRVEHPEGPDNDVTTEHHITRKRGEGAYRPV